MAKFSKFCRVIRFWTGFFGIIVKITTKEAYLYVNCILLLLLYYHIALRVEGHVTMATSPSTNPTELTAFDAGFSLAAIGIPFAKLLGKILLMHAITIGSNGIVAQMNHEILFWHGANPKLFLGIVPRIPIHFMISKCCKRELSFPPLKETKI